MLNDAIKKRIDEVSDAEEFKILIESFKLSQAPTELRDEAIRALRARHPEYDTAVKTPTRELLEQIKEGEADTSDMDGY